MIETPLERAQKRLREMREAGEEVERLDPIEKARRNPGSLRLAINGKCWECMGAGSNANTRGMIRDCSIVLCSLYSVRPYQDK